MTGLFFWGGGGLSTEGNLGFKIDWASLLWEGNFYHFCFVLFCIREQIPCTSVLGEGYIRKGDLTEGFLRYDFKGLIFGRAYFRYFTVC